jgi:hypothetical protein
MVGTGSSRRISSSAPCSCHPDRSAARLPLFPTGAEGSWTEQTAPGESAAHYLAISAATKTLSLYQG